MDFSELPRKAKKGDNGKVMVIGGSTDIHGAPILAALGALAAGSDLVALFVPEAQIPIARAKELNFLVSGFSDSGFDKREAKRLAAIAADWADVVVIGCGFLEEESAGVAEFLRHFEGMAVLDAGALFPVVLRTIRGRGDLLLTPHAGEFQRLFDRPATVTAIQEVAVEYGVTVLRKGVVDAIASPEQFAENHSGTPLMTVGGTGDTLAGICGGLLARGLSPFDAACLAAERWGKAGERLAKKYVVSSAEELLEEFRKK